MKRARIHRWLVLSWRGRFNVVEMTGGVVRTFEGVRGADLNDFLAGRRALASKR